MEKVVTNILFFDVSGTGLTAPEVSQRLKARNVLANAYDSKLIRMVTHLDVDRSGCERALQALREVVGVAGARAWDRGRGKRERRRSRQLAYRQPEILKTDSPPWLRRG